MAQLPRWGDPSPPPRQYAPRRQWSPLPFHRSRPPRLDHDERSHRTRLLPLRVRLSRSLPVRTCLLRRTRWTEPSERLVLPRPRTSRCRSRFESTQGRTRTLLWLVRLVYRRQSVRRLGHAIRRGECGLTLRSSGPPPARHLGREAVLLSSASRPKRLAGGVRSAQTLA